MGHSALDSFSTESFFLDGQVKLTLLFAAPSQAFVLIVWIDGHPGKHKIMILLQQNPARGCVSASTCSTYLQAWLGLVHVPPAQDPHLVMRLVVGQLSWQRVHTYGLEKK